MPDTTKEQKETPTSLLKYLFRRLKDTHSPTHVANGQTYAVNADGTLGHPVLLLPPQFDAPTLKVSTLSGLLSALAANIDDFQSAKPALHIVDYLTVDLVSTKSDAWGRRHVWVRAKHTEDTPFVFGQYYKPEDFLIAFRASFHYNDQAVNVQSLCSAVGSGETVFVSDDGISQEVVVKTGTINKCSIPLPPGGIPLVPWRTFRDANPVESKFLLRMKGAREGLPAIALFEIDGKWKLDTVSAIKHYLDTATAVPIIT